MKNKIYKTIFGKTCMTLILVFCLFIFITAKSIQAASGCLVDSSNDNQWGMICDPGGGAIPPDSDEYLSGSPIATTSAKRNNNPAPIGGCWKDDPKARIAPVSWYWGIYKNVHLQVYDSTGAWWFNGWVRSNSFTVFSKDGKGQYLGIPTDGRTVFAKVSYGGEFSEAGKINCVVK